MATAAQARQAYINRGARVTARIQWFDQQVLRGLNLTMQKRLDVASQLIRDKIVANISLPVEKNSQGVVIRRSIRGEFPRAETTRLMKDIFWDRRGGSRIVGTSLDYGLWLELNLDRSFLRRTLNEERGAIERIFTRRIN